MMKAFLVGVSEYNINGFPDLPKCKNDIFQLRKSMINGLNFKADSITLIGCNSTVFYDYFDYMFNNFLSSAIENDTLFFYFSGHGTKGNLVLSDMTVSLKEIINRMQNSIAKSKIIILDCCHSGDFTLDGVAQLSIDDSIIDFVGKGCTIMASCGSSQTSGFHPSRNISLFTSFLCDAIESKTIIKEGKKSLEDINKLIRIHNKAWNENNGSKVQDPIYRSNMGGTLFFNVDNYSPYPMKKIYKEKDKYIIVDVEPVHVAIAKRYSIKVILKHLCTYEMIAEITQEIVSEAHYFEVYENGAFQTRFQHLSANIIWCYFGYDEEDVVNCNFLCHTVWVDETQDKNYWYHEDKDSMLINDVLINKHTWYEQVKKLSVCTLSRKAYIEQRKECTSQLVSIAERYIQLFHEFDNKSFSENAFIQLVQPLNRDFSKWYFAQNELPVAPVDLHDWAEANMQLACTIHDLSLCYNENKVNTWSSHNRHWLVQRTIDRYVEELERLKRVDELIC